MLDFSRMMREQTMLLANIASKNILNCHKHKLEIEFSRKEIEYKNKIFKMYAELAKLENKEVGK
jgi:hypothetical protein